MSQFAYTLDVARRHWSDGRGKILLAVSSAWFLSIGVRNTFPVLLTHLQTAYGLTLATAGLLLSVLWFAYALGQLPGGILADRIGEGKTMVLSMVLGAFTIGLIVSGGSRPLLYVATGTLGFAIALFGVVRLTALSDVYPDRLGTAVGIMSAAGDLGNTALPPIAAILAAMFVWQLGFGFLVPLFLGVAIVLWIVVPSRTGTRGTGAPLSLSGAQHVLGRLSRRSVLLITAVMICSNAVYQSFTGFFPTYLIDVKGISQPVAGVVFAFFFAVGIVLKPVAGSFYDRIGARRSLFVLFVVAGFALVALTQVTSFWSIVVVTAMTSTVLGAATVILSYMTHAIPEDVLNAGLGTLRTIYMMTAATSPLLFGTIADRGYFDEAFVLLAGLVAVGLVLTTLLPER